MENNTTPRPETQEEGSIRLLRESRDELSAVLAEAVEKVPEWAKNNDEAHEWWIRAKDVISRSVAFPSQL